MDSPTASDARESHNIHAICSSVAVACGYSVEAVMLVLHVLQRMPHKRSDGSPMRATDVCQALIRTSAEAYGDGAFDALEGWRLTSSESVGRIIDALAKAQIIELPAGESVDSFRGIFSEDDLMQRLLASHDESDAPVESDESDGATTPATGSGDAQQTRSASSSVSNLIPRLIEGHFHPRDVLSLSITQRTWPYRVRVDLQRAIDQILPTMIVDHFSSVSFDYLPEGITMQDLMVIRRHENAVAVPPMHEEIDIGGDSPARCLTNALWLLHTADSRVPLAVLMAPKSVYGKVTGIKFEIAVPAVDGSVALVEQLFRRLESAVEESASYRGKVLSLEEDDHYRGHTRGIKVHRLRAVERAHVILPERTLKLLERNILRFVGQREKMRSFGMQTKKGLLFYGPPGTGKTHTIHYLAGALPGHTTLLLTAEQVGNLPEFITLARLLQPSMIVIEDADLIGRNRERMGGVCEEVMLNRLLNEMDGLREDADVLFVLTTNRPEMLEPALAARPGRIDQAIEFPLPDEAGRKKLVRLYSHNLEFDDDLLRMTVQKTDGVSAAFIKELMRRAAQFCLERADDADVNMQDIDNALEEMLFAGGSLNRTLLGAAISPEHLNRA